MAVINRLSADEIRRNFTHVGWFLWCVPVYIGDPDSDEPKLAARNWVPEWYFDLVAALYDALVALACAQDPSHEPGYPLAISGEVKGPDHGPL